jgi:tetratricopeptide (TPR) repeat protein
MNLGNTLKKAGQVDEAAVALRRVVEIREQVAPGSAELGASYSNLAQTLEATHQLDAALSMYQKGQAILEKTLGVDHPNVAIVHANLCSVYLQQEHWEGALEACEEAIRIFLARVPKHPFIADLYTMEAQAQLGRADLKKAASALEQSLSRCDGKACTSQLEPARSFTRARLSLATSADRPAALALAVRAREGFEKQKAQPEAAQVTAWLQATGLEAKVAKPAP